MSSCDVIATICELLEPGNVVNPSPCFRLALPTGKFQKKIDMSFKKKQREHISNFFAESIYIQE